MVTANTLHSVPVKEYLESDDIWRRYGQKFGLAYFMNHFVLCYCENLVQESVVHTVCVCSC